MVPVSLSLTPNLTSSRHVFTPLRAGSSAWSQLTSLPHNTHHHGVAVLNDKLYVIGGAIYTPNIQGT